MRYFFSPQPDTSRPQLPVTAVSSDDVYQQEKYYREKAEKGDINAQIKVVELILARNKFIEKEGDYKIAGKWLSKVINAEEFNSNLHRVEVTSSDLFQMRNIKIETKAAQLFILRIWSTIPSVVFQNATELKKNNNYTKELMRCGDNNGLLNKLIKDIKSRIIADIMQFTASEYFDAQVAMACLNLYIDIYTKEECLNIFQDKIPGVRHEEWLNQISATAAPFIEQELTTSLSALNKPELLEIVAHLESLDGLRSGLRKISYRIQRLAIFNEKCAEVYLDWYIKGNQFLSNTALYLACFEEKYTRLALRMHKFYSFSKNKLQLIRNIQPHLINKRISEWYKDSAYGDILIIIDMKNSVYVVGWSRNGNKISKPIDIASSLFSEIFTFVTSASFNTIAHYKANNFLEPVLFLPNQTIGLIAELATLKEYEDLGEILRRYRINNNNNILIYLMRKNSLITINIYKNESGLENMQRLGIHREQLAHVHLDFCLFLLRNPQYRQGLPINRFATVINRHIGNINLQTMQCFIDELSKQQSDIDSSQSLFLINIIKRYPTLRDKAIPLLLKALINHRDGNHLKSALKRACTVLTENEMAYVLSNIKKANDIFEFHYLGHEHVQEFFAIMFKYVNTFELIIQIMQNFPHFIIPLIRYGRGKFSLNAKGETRNFRQISFEEQVSLARLTEDAAVFFIDSLAEARKIDKELTDVVVAKIMKDLAQSQPGIAFTCGKICLDLLQSEAALDAFKFVKENDVNYEEASYECANILYCIKKNKAEARQYLYQISKTSFFYHSIFRAACQTKTDYSTPITQLYYDDFNLEVGIDADRDTTAVTIGDTSIPMSHAHQLFGCRKDKYISYHQLQEAWEEYLILKSQKWINRTSAEIEEAYTRAINLAVTGVGRYRIMREYICNPINHDCDFTKVLLNKFGYAFFGITPADIVSMNIVEKIWFNVRKGR